MNGYIHAAAMIEAESTVDGRFAIRRYRQRLAELCGISRFYALEHPGGEDAIAIELLGEFGRFRRVGGELRLDGLFGFRHFDGLLSKLGTGLGKLALLAREIHILAKIRERLRRHNSAIHQLLGIVERLLAAFQAAIGGGYQIVGLVFREVLVIDALADGCGVFRVGDSLFGFLNLGARHRAGFHHYAYAVELDLSAPDFGIGTGLRQKCGSAQQ
jgi:hypothetical protein